MKVNVKLRRHRDKPPRKSLGRLVLSVIVAIGFIFAASTVVASSASAVPVSCQYGTGYNHCAQVTAINSGSCLRMHKQPNYTSGNTSSWCGTNGITVKLECWTRGSGDADGHGDTYWWWIANYAQFSTYGGYANDWYLTTGSVSQWMKTNPPQCTPGMTR